MAKNFYLNLGICEAKEINGGLCEAKEINGGLCEAKEIKCFSYNFVMVLLHFRIDKNTVVLYGNSDW